MSIEFDNYKFDNNEIIRINDMYYYVLSSGIRSCTLSQKKKSLIKWCVIYEPMQQLQKPSLRVGASRKVTRNLDNILKRKDIYFVDKVPYSQRYDFSSSHV